MSDNDLIRRGDALAAVQEWTYCCDAEDAIAALPAIDVDPVCTCCGGTGITYQTERRCACQGPDLTDPVAVHVNMLRGTIAKPTVEQIVHLYGREAFQPMIDVAIAKALEKACLAVSEHADWPEDEHGRTEQVELFARVINAIDALPPAKQDNVADSNAREVGVKPLVDAVEALNAACDAMWNDHHRLEWNPSLFGQEMRIKEKHVKAITEAQQRLPALLAALAPTDAAQAREAGLREALKALDSLPEYGSPDVNIGVSNAYSAILALIQKGGDAYAVDPRHAPHEASPGVTAGAISKGDAE